MRSPRGVAPLEAPGNGTGEARPLHATKPAVPRLPEDRQGLLAVLRRRDFRLLWAAQAASQLADKFIVFTLLIVVYSLSNSASLQSVLMIAYTLPSVALSAPAGVYADRHDKRTLMMLTNLVRAGLILLIPLVLILPGLRSQPWPLIIITLLFSSVGQVFAPAEAASIPSLVSRGQITEATSVFMTTVIITIVLGVPAATLSIAFIGGDAPFYIAAGLFLLAALCVWRVKTNLRARTTSAVAPKVLRELKEGMAILRGSPALRLGLYQLALALVVVFTIFALGPVYMVRVLGRSDQQTYIVLVPAMVGLVGVAVVLGQVRHFPRAAVLIAAVLVTGLTLLLMGVLPSILGAFGQRSLMLPIAVVLAVVFGCALAAILVPAFTVLQEKTTDDARGRIFGGIFTVINAAVAVPLLLAGIVSDLIGVDRAIAAVGVILLIGALLVRGVYWQRLQVLEDEAAPLAAVADT